MHSEFYIYVLFRENGVPFYVGKGQGDRWRNHEYAARRGEKGHRFNLIRAMLARGVEVPKVKVHERLTEAQALEYEVALIAAIGRGKRGPLLNLTDGGDGVTGLKFRDITGETFGRLTAVRLIGSRNGLRRWLFNCSCGNTKEAMQGNVTKGSVRSCGCLARGVTSARARTHGLSGDRLYTSWSRMNQRCVADPSIKVCERWQNFANFLADMGDSWQKGLHLLRRSADQDFSPRNCFWAKPHTNSRPEKPTHHAHYIDTPLGPMTVSAAARHGGVARKTLRQRMANGWPVERLFDPPTPYEGRVPWNLGIPRSAHVKEAISKANTGRQWTPEQREARAAADAARRGRKRPDHAAFMRAWWHTKRAKIG